MIYTVAEQPEYVRFLDCKIALLCKFHSRHSSNHPEVPESAADPAYRAYFDSLYEPIEECFNRAYPGGGSRCFWKAVCSEPVPVQKFVEYLTITLDPTEMGNLVDRPDMIKQGRDVALGAALIAAHQADRANRSFFAGDLSSLETARYGHELRRELKVHVRGAAEWLLAVPLRRHLVPRSLAQFIEGESRPPHSRRPGAPVPRVGEGAETAKPASASMLRNFVADYVAKAQAEGSNPSQTGLEKKWRAAGHTGHRQQLNTALADLLGGTKRGRPARTRGN